MAQDRCLSENMLRKDGFLMDELDYRILQMLKENARQKASDISKEVHLSISTVIDRIHRMEDMGIITSYTAITDDSKVGNDVTALMEVSLEHPRYNEAFIKGITDNPKIISCYYLTGEFDFLLKISCRSSEELEHVHRWVNDLGGIRQTKTHFVLRTIKNIYSSLPVD